MAQIAVVTYIDDYDKTETRNREDITNVEFAWGGTVYEIDLTLPNSEKFREAILPFLEVSRRKGRYRLYSEHTPITTTPSTDPDKEERKQARRWAISVGLIPEKQRGKISNELLKAYRDRNKPIPHQDEEDPGAPDEPDIIDQHAEIARSQAAEPEPELAAQAATGTDENNKNAAPAAPADDPFYFQKQHSNAPMRYAFLKDSMGNPRPGGEVDKYYQQELKKWQRRTTYVANHLDENGNESSKVEGTTDQIRIDGLSDKHIAMLAALDAGTPPEKVSHLSGSKTTLIVVEVITRNCQLTPLGQEALRQRSK
ncbi:Lsr2 family protein [Streptomyces roseifaciens]